jgi:Tol biopolymer transport system component
LAICFTATDAGGTAHIWKLSLTDTLAVQLTTGAFTDRSPRFSPDGARILFASNRGGLWGVWSVSPSGEGTALGVLAYDAPGAEIRHPVWSPDGKRVLLSSNRSGDRALWILSDLGL